VFSLQEEGWAFLETMHHLAQERGEEYFQSRRVQWVQQTGPMSYEAAVRGSEVYTVGLDFHEGLGWDGDCSCPIGGDCKHVFAALRTLLEKPELLRARPAKARSASGSDGELSFRARVRDACGGVLTAEQDAFVSRLQKLHALCQQRRAIYATDFAELGLPLRKIEEAQLVWPQIPAKLHDFWLHVASEVEERGGAIPPFMEPLTDTAKVRAQLGQWRRQQSINEWRHTLTNAQRTRAMAAATKLRYELRIRFREDLAVLEWKRPEDENFAPIKAGQASRLGEEIANGNVELPVEDELLWNSFCAGSAPFDYGRYRTEWRYDDNDLVESLNGFFRMDAFASQLVNAEGKPFERSTEELRWHLEAATTGDDDYHLRLVRADGSVAPPVLFALEGRPTLYVTGGVIFPGPGEHAGLDRENAIPAPALETRAGAEFLRSLGIGLPPRLESRVQIVPLHLAIVCEIEGRRESSEQCVVRMEARTPEGDVMDHGAQEHWGSDRETRAKPAKLQDDGPIVLYDRTEILPPAAILHGMEMKWDAWFRRWTTRVTKKFPEVFGRWLKSLPASVVVELKGELASFAQEPIAGSIRLDASETDVDWFDLRVVLDVEDTKLTSEEVKLLLNARGAYVRLSQKGWRRLEIKFSEDDEAQLARLGLTSRELTGEPQRLHALQLADGAAKKFLPAQQYQRVERRASELKARVTPDVPAGIKAELRRYQRDGYHFLAYLSENRFGGILADDMGLGKTVQTLAWLLWLRARPSGNAPGPSLVVCPKSVTDNWRAEVVRFAPELRVRVWTASELSQFSYAIGDADLHVINYAQLRALGEILPKVKWLAAILDEGQYIKNPASITARIACALRAEHRVVLTGTPIENRLLDLWSLMAFAMPGVLGNQTQFARLYDAKGDPLARKRLSARVRPFLLRRTKSQVAKDLPERIEEDLFCDIEGEQKTLYRAELKRAQQMLLRVKTQNELAKQQFNFLTSLLRLRQICCHAKLVKADSAATSAKVEALLEQLEPLIEEGHKVLVFSQFVDMLKIIREALEQRGWPLFYLAGDTENRGELVEQFQNLSGPAVFLISLKAGGFGLNLTAASYVVLFDPWWNPAVENQAIDRTHRIGQRQNVIAYRLLIKDSIEDKIRALQKKKSALAEDVLGEEKFAQSLTIEDLRYLLSDATA
jgi:hypothetical protein